jgi:biotin operon repressor
MEEAIAELESIRSRRQGDTPDDQEPKVAANHTLPLRGAATAARPERRRNDGKAAQCKGIYVAAIEKGETPPTGKEIATRVGCNEGTVSRAIKQLEDQRKGYSADASKDRHRERGGPERLRNKRRPLRND